MRRVIGSSVTLTTTLGVLSRSFVTCRRRSVTTLTFLLSSIFTLVGNITSPINILFYPDSVATVIGCPVTSTTALRIFSRGFVTSCRIIATLTFLSTSVFTSIGNVSRSIRGFNYPDSVATVIGCPVTVTTALRILFNCRLSAIKSTLWTRTSENNLRTLF